MRTRSAPTTRFFPTALRCRGAVTPLAAACLAAALLAGCGDSGSSGTPDGGDPGDPADPNGAADPGDPADPNGTTDPGDPAAPAGPSGGPSPGPDPDDGTGTPAEGGGDPDGGGDPVVPIDNGARDTAGADLTHAGRPVPRNDVDPMTLPQVSTAGRSRVMTLPGMAVIYEVTENHGGDTDVNCREVGAEYGSCSVANLHIGDANGELADDDWQLWFHSLRRILRVDSDRFEVFHVNGDLHYLAPVEGSTGVEGGVATLRFVNEFSTLAESDIFPRYWIVRDGQAPELLPNTDEASDETRYAMPITGDNRLAFNGDRRPLATPAVRFAANADVTARAAALDARTVQSRVIPTPRSMTSGSGDLNIAGGFSFAGTALDADAVAALAARQATFMTVGTAVPLAATIDASLEPGTHTLDVTTGSIVIAGHDAEALFHGAQSLLGLVRPGVATIPTVSIVDGPRFEWRGMHVDVARSFHTVESIERLLDQMAAYKLNVLHLHLSDDEGWRLAIAALPELTSVGGRRAFALDADGAVTEADTLMPLLGSGPFETHGSGHYSRGDFVRLLRHATARHIRIVPEFDMPAHARAAVVAMRARAANLGTPTDTSVRIDDPDDGSRYVTVQHYDDGILNPCVPGTYTFVETVVGEVKSMYDEAGAPLDIWHMGGDEAGNIYRGPGYPNPDTSRWDLPWERSPACEAYIDATDGVGSRGDLERHFVERVSAIVANAGIPALYAWHEVLETIPADTLATESAGTTYWGSASSGRSTIEALNGYAGRGYDVVLALPDFLYFSFPEEIDPEERGNYWGTRSLDVEKVFGLAPENLPQNAETSRDRNGFAWSGEGAGPAPRVIGMQGHVWSEFVRTSAQLDTALYPRLLALAERAWHRAGWELDYDAGTTFTESSTIVDTDARAADYALFAAALGQKELAKLDAAGAGYRIPVPGASTANGSLDMNAAYPGLPLEYSSDGASFTRWSPGAPASATTVRARSVDGARAGRADAIE